MRLITVSLLACLTSTRVNAAPIHFTHMADASAGESVGHDLIVVANDEDNLLRVYRLPDGGEVPFGHPQNILGTRWITLSATGATPPARLLGLHGTWDVSSLGRISDAGRVRFRNADIEELCVLLPDGAPVKIVD